MYFSIWGMLKKGSAAAGTAIGLSAAALFGFDPQADPALAGTADGNSQNSLMWLALWYSIIPASIKFIAFPFMLRYPLTEARQKRIRARIERRAAT